MKQTLRSFPVEDLTGTGTFSIRVAPDGLFQASTLEVHLPGDSQGYYFIIPLTVVGTQGQTDDCILDTTDDSSDPNATYSAWVMRGNVELYQLFERWSFTASFGASTTFGAIQEFNTHRAPLRDDKTYTKRQINLLLAALITPLTAKAVGVATLSGGTVTVANALVASDSKILITSKGDGVTGTPRVSSQTAGVGFTITSTNFDSGDVAWVII